jgi:DNA-binding CsgD family transcriptional regulator
VTDLNRLSDRQRDVLTRVIRGDVHEDIAKDYGVVKTAITNDLKNAAHLLGAVNTASAVAAFTRAATLISAAKQVSAGIPSNPQTDAGREVAQTLQDVVRTLRLDAERPGS